MESEPEGANVSAPDVTATVCLKEYNSAFLHFTDSSYVVKPTLQEASQQSAAKGAIPAAGSPKIPAAAMPMPEAVLAQGQSLKFLLISWFNVNII